MTRLLSLLPRLLCPQVAALNQRVRAVARVQGLGCSGFEDVGLRPPGEHDGFFVCC